MIAKGSCGIPPAAAVASALDDYEQLSWGVLLVADVLSALDGNEPLVLMMVQ